MLVIWKKRRKGWCAAEALQWSQAVHWKPFGYDMLQPQACTHVRGSRSEGTFRFSILVATTGLSFKRAAQDQNEHFIWAFGATTEIRWKVTAMISEESKKGSIAGPAIPRAKSPRSSTADQHPPNSVRKSFTGRNARTNATRQKSKDAGRCPQLLLDPLVVATNSAAVSWRIHEADSKLISTVKMKRCLIKRSQCLWHFGALQDLEIDPFERKKGGKWRLTQFLWQKITIIEAGKPVNYKWNTLSRKRASRHSHFTTRASSSSVI